MSCTNCLKNIQRPLINQRRPRAGGVTWPRIATVTICRFVVAVASECIGCCALTSRCEKSETFSSFFFSLVRHVPVVEHIRFVDSCRVDNVGDPESVQLSSAFLTAVDVFFFFFFFSLGPINVSFSGTENVAKLRRTGARPKLALNWVTWLRETRRQHSSKPTRIE